MHQLRAFCRFFSVLSLLVFFGTSSVVLAEDTPSPVIQDIHWGAETYHYADGADNWPATWADDGKLYAAGGDSEGAFDPVSYKHSLIVSSITGYPNDNSIAGQDILCMDRPDILGPCNVSSGGNYQGKYGIKASGILFVNGTLYMYVRNADGNGNQSRLGWSQDYGQTWTWGFTWDEFGYPTFINFGQNYANAPDNYVYVVSHDNPCAYDIADSFILMRVPKDKITDKSEYEFFCGTGANPDWSNNIQDRAPVFTNPGKCQRSGITYNAGIKRYLWWQGIPVASGEPRTGFGIYDAPNPWGPWTKVFSTDVWDINPGETGSFPAKWMSPDGKEIYLVFSGDDSFSVRKATLTTVGPATGDSWVEDFSGVDPANDETQYTAVRDSGEFSVLSEQFHITGEGSEGVWTSQPIDISNLSSVTISVDVDGAGTVKEDSDYVRIYYKLDGGNEVLIDELVNDFQPTTVSMIGISGNTIEIIIRSKVSASNEHYFFDNIMVKEDNAAIRHEAEQLAYVATDTFSTFDDTGASNGQAKKLRSNAMGDYVDLTVPVSQTGLYNVKIGYRTYTSRGFCQLSIDGIDQGPEWDQYGATQWHEIDLGPKEFLTSGDKHFRFTVTQKNPSSSGYDITVDYIELEPISSSFPSTELYEAEQLVYVATDAFSTFDDAAASNGQAKKLKANSVGDYVDMVIPISQAGTYDVKVRYKAYNSRGFCQLSIDGVDQGAEWDQYGTTQWHEINLGPKEFLTSGDKHFRFTVTRKNPLSSGYNITVDYVELSN